MDLETVTLSEVRQTEKHKYVISLTCGIEKKKDTNEPIYKAEIKGFPGDSMVKKNPPADVGNKGLIPGRGRSHLLRDY